jgi:hypothetical protein
LACGANSKNNSDGVRHLYAREHFRKPVQEAIGPHLAERCGAGRRLL